VTPGARVPAGCHDHPGRVDRREAVPRRGAAARPGGTDSRRDGEVEVHVRR
jgi:hypothetical protein